MRLRPVSSSTRTLMANYIASRLLRHADGPTDAPGTWADVCERLGIGVKYFCVPGAHAGEWCADIADGEPAVVAINRAYPDEHQARAFVHELAELLMFRLQPPLLPDMSDAGRYDGQPDTEQHKIARRVEALVLKRG